MYLHSKGVPACRKAESNESTTFGLLPSTTDLIYLPALSEGKRKYRKTAVISMPYIVYAIHFFVFIFVTVHGSTVYSSRFTVLISDLRPLWIDDL
jgi:hypothetical protein